MHLDAYFARQKRFQLRSLYELEKVLQVVGVIIVQSRWCEIWRYHFVSALEFGSLLRVILSLL